MSPLEVPSPYYKQRLTTDISQITGDSFLLLLIGWLAVLVHRQKSVFSVQRQKWHEFYPIYDYYEYDYEMVQQNGW